MDHPVEDGEARDVGVPARHVAVHDLGGAEDGGRRGGVAADEEPEGGRDLRLELESLGPRADGDGVGDVLPLGRLVHLGQGTQDPEGVITGSIHFILNSLRGQRFLLWLRSDLGWQFFQRSLAALASLTGIVISSGWWNILLAG